MQRVSRSARHVKAGAAAFINRCGRCFVSSPRETLREIFSISLLQSFYSFTSFLIKIFTACLLGSTKKYLYIWLNLFLDKSKKIFW
jgi:hypothetical protein